jgi:hypothetical protein
MRATGILMSPSGPSYTAAMTPSRYKAIRERLLQTDADLVLAADETDRDLIAWFATLPLRQRLERAAGMAAELARLRDARRTG